MQGVFEDIKLHFDAREVGYRIGEMSIGCGSGIRGSSGTIEPGKDKTGNSRTGLWSTVTSPKILLQVIFRVYTSEQGSRSGL
jgi:hypothetical protein